MTEQPENLSLKKRITDPIVPEKPRAGSAMTHGTGHGNKTGEYRRAQMDNENAALIIQLLLEDCEEALSSTVGKGKRPIGARTDQHVALDLYLQEINSAQAFASDRRMATSVQQAIRSDGLALSHSQEEERRAEQDHTLSIAISRGATHSTPEANPTDQVTAADDDDEFIEKLLYIYVDGVDDIERNDDSEACHGAGAGFSSAMFADLDGKPVDVTSGTSVGSMSARTRSMLAVTVIDSHELKRLYND
ncbi:hypothetical protein E8E14_005759 [Neopestalotiopsis sp. 37M]|nr:hypothetical protein E8E14_005759 [Neopestalotiopsis sp. 37M]